MRLRKLILALVAALILISILVAPKITSADTPDRMALPNGVYCGNDCR